MGSLRIDSISSYPFIVVPASPFKASSALSREVIIALRPFPHSKKSTDAEIFGSKMCIRDRAKGVDKAAAVHWILNRRPDIDEVRVMGDSANDAGMIREFHGAAPVWASAEVRQTAAGVLNDLSLIHI